MKRKRGRARARKRRNGVGRGLSSRVHPRARGRDGSSAMDASGDPQGPPARARKRLGEQLRRPIGSTRARAEETAHDCLSPFELGPPARARKRRYEVAMIAVGGVRVHPRARGRDDLRFRRYALCSCRVHPRARGRDAARRRRDPRRPRTGSTRARAEETRPASTRREGESDEGPPIDLAGPPARARKRPCREDVEESTSGDFPKSTARLRCLGRAWVATGSSRGRTPFAARRRRSASVRTGRPRSP